MVQVKVTSIRLGHPFAGKKHIKRADPVCDINFYTAPKFGDKLSAADPLKVTWSTDPKYTACLENPSTVVVILTSATGGHLREVSDVPFASGSYSINLDPSWWNSSSSVEMEVSIASESIPTFLNNMPAGPLFNVTYDGKKASAAIDEPDPGLKTAGGVAKSGGLPKGSIAAAVLLPILAVMATIFAYIKISRHKTAEKRRRWSQKLDNRMSRLSGDWKASDGLPRAGDAAIRDSSASGMFRMSTVFAQDPQMGVRPSLDRASFAMGRPSGETIGTAGHRGSQFVPGERISRVSFAADVNASRERLSTYSGARSSTYSIGRASRAFHVGVVPPVPRPPAIRTDDTESAIRDSNVLPYDEDHYLSPTQTYGPVPLSSDDIASQDIGPALHLMRATNNPAIKSSEDLLLAPPTPTYQTPVSPLGASAFAPPLSPIGHMPMQAQSAIFMSPDDMLKQYAQARANGVKSPTSPHPVYLSPQQETAPQLQFTATGMRNLTGDDNLTQP